MASLKNVSTSPSSSFEINLLSSDSSEAESVGPSSSTKKCPSVAKNKVSKKSRFALPDSLTDEDSLRFWGLEHKSRFVSFSKSPIVPGRVVNLEHLEVSHCAVSTFFRAQKLSLLLRLCGLESYEEPVRLFYANLRISIDSGEWETLVLVATTLIPRKGSLSNISNRDVYVVYCLLKKLRINWAPWFREYMVESLEDTNSSSSLPYGLLISRIIVDSLKEFVQQRADAPKVLQDTLGKVLQLHKDSSTDVGKLRLEVEGLKKKAIRSINTILK
ncbi:hypothetical protein KY289_013310 [Solanum tuberosum]|nr:hypothetical protein KY289_013310 [Solanum tuberosum]